MEAYRWYRRSQLVKPLTKEVWSFYIGDTKQNDIEVDLFFTKELDIKSIKKRFSFKKELEHTERIRTFFEETDDFMLMGECPVCSSGIEHSDYEMTIWGNDYHMCKKCQHVYCERFPSKEAMNIFYKTHAVNNDYYVNPEEIETRLTEIYQPKVEWIIERYKNLHKKDPVSILDLGAGAGHFLAACKRSGLKVNGLEYDKRYRSFCETNFGIDLFENEKDISEKDYDIVCSFNVIEHTFNPFDFVGLYKQHMHNKSIAVIETPKFNALTTSVQRIFPESVRGHVFPYEHNHLFTDASLATLIELRGMRTTAVWYYGQDAVEVLLQAYNASSSGDNYDIVGKMMPLFQKSLDEAYLSDIMTFVAVNQ